MIYLADTNACLDFLLRRNPGVISQMRAMFGRVAVSTITLAELRVGAKSTSNPHEDDRTIDRFIGGVIVQPFDEAAAVSYGTMVRQIGMRRGSFDRLIAAHALALDLTLVTNNTRDFADIPGLRVENWAA